MIAPFAWYGGKALLSKKFLPLIPPHTYYGEVFGGAASLLFAKPRSRFEVYNDIDSGMVNFFRILRDGEAFKILYEKIQLTPYAREEYNYCRETWENVEDRIEKAYRWFIMARMSFSGANHSWGYSMSFIRKNMPLVVSAYLSAIDRLPQLHKRIMTVQIEHLDWRDFMDKYNWGKDGFYYLDPPYLLTTRKGKEYKHELEDDKHKNLIDYLLDIRDGRQIMLSGYESELYQRLEDNGWIKKCWDVACYSTNGELNKNRQRRRDCIWMNYKIYNNLFN